MTTTRRSLAKTLTSTATVDPSGPSVDEPDEEVSDDGIENYVAAKRAKKSFGISPLEPSSDQKALDDGIEDYVKVKREDRKKYTKAKVKRQRSKEKYEAGAPTTPVDERVGLHKTPIDPEKTPMTEEFLGEHFGMERAVNQYVMGVNVDPRVVTAHIQHNIRLGFQQVMVQEPRADAQKILLLGGGPSLADSEEEIRDLHFKGAKLITMNGTYNWCIERNLQPSAFVMLDARPQNKVFVGPPVAGCKYFIASQVHPEVAKLYMERDTFIIHCTQDHLQVKMLDEFYQGNFLLVTGGSTVMLRAIWLMRMLGYEFMEIFGFDSCFLDGKHHAYEQDMNYKDEVQKIHCAQKEFQCAHWHVSQAEDFMGFIKEHGHKFFLNVHGDGLISHMIKKAAQFYVEDRENGS